MSFNLKTFLHNVLTPVDRYTLPLEESSSPSQNGYKWTYVKNQSTIKYLQIDSSHSEEKLEKILFVMNKQLKVFIKNPFVEEDEKRQLASLKIMVTSYTKAYKQKHSGISGKIYLLWSGIFNGGSVDALSSKIHKKILLLEAKRTGQTPTKAKRVDAGHQMNLDTITKKLDSFLKNAAPPEDFEPGENKWFYCKKKKIIKYTNESLVDSSIPGSDIFSKCKLERILAEMTMQFREFKKLEFIEEAQKNQLANLKELIDSNVTIYKSKHSKSYQFYSGLRNGGTIDTIYKSVSSDIDFLLNQINSPPPPSGETKEQMQFRAMRIRMEIFQTEDLFISKLDSAIEGIYYLISLKSGDLLCTPEMESFFKKTQGHCLPKCLEAFSLLKTLSSEIRETLEASLNEGYTEHEKNRAVAELYISPLFRSYSQAMTLAARYYDHKEGSLTKLMSALELANGWAPHHQICKRFKNDCNYYIEVVQRLPRHQLLMLEFFKNIPSDSNVYPIAFSGWEEAERNVRDMNKKLHQTFGM